ncbi:hypothetical protein TCAL_00599 [Tigriopus californicus]|uniref:Fucosyltransferase n=1 Tax=Tigriopus californicus TaxID=6832 RepID=A0A553PA76_TIGCA|nr:alpha-(1,3)-fucosyltransferase C-like [Tigriopus californicus]TRY74595.1 hypothetical protein TCAL_00599 [Tigriopus californicus]
MESAKLANLTSTSEISASKATRNESLPVKKLLYFNHFFEQWDWKFGQGGPELFQQQGCRVTNCYITSNKTKFGTIAEFDAVLFYKRLYNFSDPNIIPDQKQRKSSQRYVMMMQESPMHDYANYHKLQDFFNWTMTYRMDSDIPIPYGLFVPKGDVQESIQNEKTWRAFNYAEFQATLAKRPTEFLQMAKRPNQVLWYVSHCNAASERDKYAAELSKYINVSIYGKCTMVRPRIDQVLSQFKFYLSFENSFCTDYITEKFFKRISQGILPIVLGGGNYTRVAPPHSFINVLDFPSPRELAKYLMYLDENREQYLSYFWWMDYYSVVHKLQLSEGICQLCQMLNADLPVKTYHSMSDWWRGPRGTRSNSTCRARYSFPWSKYNSRRKTLNQ